MATVAGPAAPLMPGFPEAHPSAMTAGLPPPHEVFPPTDFHSATRVDGRLLMLGCLGYPRQRAPGVTPDFAVYRDLYAPPVGHTRLEDLDDAVGTARIVVDGVTVRYVEDHRALRITIEGALPTETEAALIEDARSKLSAHERTAYTAATLRE